MSLFSVFRSVWISLAITTIAISVLFLILRGWFDNAGDSSADQALPASSKTIGQIHPSSPRVLYWVAPMDANYRRDTPGKSPMGMDLVPVYEQVGVDASEGEIQVNPAIINSLGVRTELVSRKLLQPKITAFGVIAHDEDSRIQMTVRTQGWIENLSVSDQGEMVTEGDLLFELYSPELLHAQDNFLSARLTGDSRLVRGALGQMRSLAIPESRIHQLQALAPHAGLPDRFRTLAYRAPTNGHVSLLGITEGSFVTPSTIALEIVSIENVWMIADVFERNLSKIQVGQLAQMQVDAFPARRWQGQVEYLYPMLDMTTRSQRVRLRFSNPDRQLKPNMFASVDILTSTFEALSVPVDAVIKVKGESRVVLALGQGRFRSTVVEVGWQVGDRQVILAGLSHGDRVVVRGQFLLDSESNLAAELSRMESSK